MMSEMLSAEGYDMMEDSGATELGKGTVHCTSCRLGACGSWWGRHLARTPSGESAPLSGRQQCEGRHQAAGLHERPAQVPYQKPGTSGREARHANLAKKQIES